MTFRLALTLVLLLMAGCTNPELPANDDIEAESDVEGLPSPTRAHTTRFDFSNNLGGIQFGPVTGNSNIRLNHTGEPFAAKVGAQATSWTIWVWQPDICEATEESRIECERGLLAGESGAGYLVITESDENVIDEAGLGALDCLTECMVKLARPPEDARRHVPGAWTWAFGDPAGIDLECYDQFAPPGDSGWCY